MYERFYGLSEKPFSLSPNPKYLYFSESHQSAFNLVRYGIREREPFIVVTGDVGTGKTTLCRAILESLDQDVFTSLVLNPFLSDEDLLKVILQNFGILSENTSLNGRFRPSRNDLVYTLNQVLLSFRKINARAVLIVDEAQNLPLATLEQIRILSNLETSSEKLLQVILVGQQELDGLLGSPQLRQLDQRVSIRFQLKPLCGGDIEHYVYHRLAVAGCGRRLEFTKGAFRLIYKHSRGIPRLINLICDRSLMGGYAMSTFQIDKAVVKHALTSLQLRPARLYRPSPYSRPGRWRTLVVGRPS